QKVPSLGAIINRSDYEIFLGDVIIPEEWILEWLDSNEVTTPRQHKEGIKEIDIRPFVEKFFLNKNKLLITIKTIEGRTAKITEILESLLASHGVDYRQFLVQRTAQYVVEENKILTPFDVLPS
nr:DUF2344 domain-containing protein [Calditrichia bacterium]